MFDNVTKSIRVLSAAAVERANSGHPGMPLGMADIGVVLYKNFLKVSELLIAATNALEDNAWLGGSVSFAERNLDVARFNFQNAVKFVYQVTDENEIRPVTEYEEYDVGDIPDEFKKLNQNK